jgi:hypothetical protein
MAWLAGPVKGILLEVPCHIVLDAHGLLHWGMWVNKLNIDVS